MSLDDRLIGTVTSKIYEIESDAKLWQSTIILQLTKTSKQAILTDLLEIIGEDEPCRTGTSMDCDSSHYLGNCDHVPRNELRQELRDKVRKYCE